MSSEEGYGSIDGLALDEAVERVAAANDRHDPADVRSVLSFVTDDGVVSEAGVQSAFDELSKVVSTPETRIERAEQALDDARDAAEPVDHLDTVSARLETFEQQAAGVRKHVHDLGGLLQQVIDRHEETGDPFDTAVGIARLRNRATQLQDAADDLQAELEEFETWLDSEPRRLTTLEEDVAAVEGELDDLDTAVDGVEEAADPAVQWVQATVGHRVTELLVADLRAELADLRAWAGGVDDEARVAEIDADLDALAAGVETTGDRLDALAEPAWRERFDDELATFHAALDEVEPPIDWNELQGTVQANHPAPGQ